MDDWKKIKLIHVSKFIFWNAAVAFVLLLFGSDYLIKFWVTFSIMIALLLTLGLKVFIGSIYLITYRLCGRPKSRKQPPVEDQVDFYFEKVKKSLYADIRSSME
jgi:hypothetical protein